METEAQMFQMISPPSGFPYVPLPFGDGVLSLLFFPVFSLCLPLPFGKRRRPSYFFMRFFRVEAGDTGLLFLLFVFHISLLVFLFPKVGSRAPLLFGMGANRLLPHTFF